jgi:hypothetical protein
MGGTPFATLRSRGRLLLSRRFKENRMADTKDKIKVKIDDAAQKAKELAGTAVDKTKSAAKTVGQKVKDAGEKIKEQGS